MEYTKLGRSNMTVSKICLGTMHFGPKASEEESHAILDKALEMGITFLDTATNYRLTLRNGVLVYRKLDADTSTASATIRLANTLRLLAFTAGDLASPGLDVTGDGVALASLLAVLDQPDPGFNIVTP